MLVVVTGVVQGQVVLLLGVCSRLVQLEGQQICVVATVDVELVVLGVLRPLLGREVTEGLVGG